MAKTRTNSELLKIAERVKSAKFNPEDKRTVKIEVVEVANNTRDIKNSSGKTKKILPGVLKTLAPVLGRDGMMATGVSPDEYEGVMKHNPMNKKDFADFYQRIFVKIGAAGKELKLSNPKDFLVWKYLHFHPEVCIDRKKLNTAHHTFVMIDTEKEAEEKLSAADYKVEGYTIIGEMSEEATKDFLVLYGRNPQGISYKEAKSLLIDQIEANPKKFVTYYNDSAKEYKINLKKFLTEKVITKKGGVYYFGEDVSLGATPEQVVENLRSADNQQLYIKMLDLLDE